jgi:hypothetical protein
MLEQEIRKLNTIDNVECSCNDLGFRVVMDYVVIVCRRYISENVEVIFVYLVYGCCNNVVRYECFNNDGMCNHLNIITATEACIGM